MKIKRVVLNNPVPLGSRFPARLLDAETEGVREMTLVGSVVEVSIEGDPEPYVIPLSSIAVLIPYRESPEETLAALEATGPGRPKKAKR